MLFFVFVKTIVLVLSHIVIFDVVPASTEKYPIILIPGDGGSQAYCVPDENASGFLLWINLRYFLSPASLEEYFRIIYDPKTGDIRDADLCKVIFPGWGDTWSIENLGTYKHTSTTYFENLVSALRQDKFFVSNVTIRGAPFDFRRAPNQNEGFFKQLKSLIEDAYVKSGKKKVVVLGHSLGSLYSLAFFKAVSLKWKRQYVKTFLSVSGPLAGSVKALKIEASGDNFGVFIRSPLSFRPVQRSLPSIAFLLPDPHYWPASEPIIITPSVNYSAHDYESFFRDINHTAGYQLMINTKPFVDGSVGPTGLDEVYCVYGIGLPTTYRLLYSPPTFYRSGFPDQYPTLIPGNGDGTVHARSLELCRSWPGAKHVVFDGAEHLRIVGDPRFIDLVRQLTGAEPAP